MPIYAYRCESCGHSKDVLQKISDAPLTVCPKCGAASFRKQVTAAGFRLKGAGWYVTDFRGGDAAAAPASADNGAHAEAKTDPKVDGKPSEGAAAPAKSDAAPAKSPAGPAKPDAAPAPAPAADSSH